MSAAVAAERVRRSAHAVDNGFEARPGFVPFDLAQAESVLPDRIRQIAAAHADAVAVIDGGETRTYRQLMQAATRLAAAFEARLDGRPGPIALQMADGLPAIEALLGILFAGRPYFCCSPLAPDAELSSWFEAATPAAVVGSGPPSAGPEAGPVWIDIEAIRRTPVGEAAVRAATPRDHACLFATSGSTGRPKIVALSHRALIFDIGRQTNDLFLGPDDRFLLTSPLSFSASLAPLFGSLLTGGRLYVHDARAPLPKLREALGRSDITIATLSVSALRAACAGGPLDAPRLRLLSASGEPLTARDVEAFRATFAPGCVLQNAMASTETRTYAQYFVPRARALDDVVPIGWAVDQKELLIVGEDGEPVPTGQPGDVVVRSRFLADGYLNDPALTGALFRPQSDGTVLFRTGDRARSDDAGALVFLGRSDAVVKIRGYRVDLGGIEAALTAHEAVAGVVVLAEEASRDELCAAAYVVPRPGRAPTADALREFLEGRLPGYKVPARITILDAFPLNANGKIDRSALRATRQAGSRSAAAGEDAAVALAGIWSRVLKRSPVGWTDDFFTSGGDSLAALQVQAAIHERFGLDLPLDVMLRRPTLDRLAEWIEEAQGTGARAGNIVPLRLGGRDIPLFCVHGIGGEVHSYMPLVRRLKADRPVFGIRATAGSDGDASIEALAARYVPQVLDRLADRAPVLLCGHSFGGVVVYEMARQLRALGRSVGLLAVVDTPLHTADERHALGRGRDALLNLPSWIRYDVVASDWRRLAARAAGQISRSRRALAGRFRRSSRPDAPDPRVYWGLSDVPAHFGAALTTRYHAIASYCFPGYDGPVVLLRARAGSLTRRRDAAMGWQTVATGGVTVHDVPGSHHSCVTEPHVRRVARVIERHMTETTR